MKEHIHLHVLQSPVVLLPGCNVIIIIIYITVPVTTVAIPPAGDNNIVDIIDAEIQIFNCITNSSRPAAWIQWYIGGQNVTNQATPQAPQQDGDKLISSSSLVYTGRDATHNKTIVCEAVDIEGRQKVKSAEKSLYIKCKYSKTPLYCPSIHRHTRVSPRISAVPFSVCSNNPVKMPNSHTAIRHGN